mmetsp:Transcript_88030/g.244360  ORF Transcript_88030/g.244360 Transcript_88030/m.244360 type:complete len:215 (-) Transcript_88030:12-656(-)
MAAGAACATGGSATGGCSGTPSPPSWLVVAVPSPSVDSLPAESPTHGVQAVPTTSSSSAANSSPTGCHDSARLLGGLSAGDPSKAQSSTKVFRTNNGRGDAPAGLANSTCSLDAAPATAGGMHSLSVCAAGACPISVAVEGHAVPILGTALNATLKVAPVPASDQKSCDGGAGSTIETCTSPTGIPGLGVANLWLPNTKTTPQATKSGSAHSGM